MLYLLTKARSHATDAVFKNKQMEDDKIARKIVSSLEKLFQCYEKLFFVLRKLFQCQKKKTV